MRRSVALLLLCALPALRSTLALYSPSDPVVELTAANFDRLVLEADGVAVVEFYAPWCGHCQALAPQYKKVASNLQGLALVGAVNCDDKKSVGNLCHKYGIKGFPTLKLFGADKTRDSVTGQLSKEAVDYQGARTAKPLADAVTALLSDLHISRPRSREELATLAAAAAGKAQVLLFTNKQGSTTLYKALSTQLHAGLAFAEVHESAAELVKHFAVESFPTLLVLKADGSGKYDRYGGELKAPALKKYLAGHSTAPPPPEPEAGAAKKEGKPKPWAFVRQVEGLGELAELDAREDMALLALHGAEGAEGCKDAREMFLAAAGDMQAVVDTLLVSVPAAELAEGSEAASALGRMGVNVEALRAEACELQVVLLPFGKDKADLEDYKLYEGPPEGKALQAWATEAIPPLLTKLDDSIYNAWLVLDPSDGRMELTPKVVLYTNKKEAPGVFRALAMSLRGRGNMAFAWVQANSPAAENVVKNMKPTRVPGLTVIMPQSRGALMDPSGVSHLHPYVGPLKYSDMHDFLLDMAKQVEAASGVATPEEFEAALPQITSQADMESYCTGKGGLCVLALLDSSRATHQEEHRVVTALALQQAQGGTFSFAWLEAPKHRGIVQAFGLMRSDLPTLVMVAPRRLRFAAMPAPEEGSRLQREPMAAFLEAVLGGKARTEPLQALPVVREGDDLAPGDPAGSGSASQEGPGQGAEEEVVEEEFDLSDIMAEELEGGGVGGKADRLAEVEAQLQAEEEARKAAETKKAKKKKSKKAKKAKKEEL